jgi:hypothetical protein
MVRTFLCSMAVLAFLTAGLMADDQKTTKKTTGKDTGISAEKGTKNKHAAKATITHVDPKKGTVTVKMKDKNGKEVEKTFTLAEDVRMIDDTGRVAALDVFQSGNEVLVIEAEGRLRELHKARAGDKTSTSGTQKK